MFATNSSGVALGFGNRGIHWMRGSAGSTLYSHCITPNNLSCGNGSSVPFGAYTLASNHANGVQLAYLDGRVAFVNDSIELRVWRAQGTRAGNDH
jgi:hypothetical protein